MVGDLQRTAAVWAVLTVPFLLIATPLWTRDELTGRFVAAYWFAPVALTLVGAIPAPWQALGD